MQQFPKSGFIHQHFLPNNAHHYPRTQPHGPSSRLSCILQQFPSCNFRRPDRHRHIHNSHWMYHTDVRLVAYSTGIPSDVLSLHLQAPITSHYSLFTSHHQGRPIPTPCHPHALRRVYHPNHLSPFTNLRVMNGSASFFVNSLDHFARPLLIDPGPEHKYSP